MKRLIVCCDGTWKDDDDASRESNVSKIKKLVLDAAPDGVQQVTQYIAGVGTGSTFDKLFGGLTGAGVTQNVLDGYNHLAAHYEPGDEIYLFGFSRGAYTARAIAGMIGDCGLAKRENGLERLVTNALHLGKAAKKSWRRWLRDEGSDRQDVEPTHQGVRVACVGVWDTVGALGIPTRIEELEDIRTDVFEFHDTQLGGHVDHAFHALAIDEKRQFFDATLWTGTKPPETRTVEQVWFPGVHSNVGGGYEDRGLSNLTLSWMIDRVEQETALRFDADQVQELHGRSDGLLHESRRGFKYARDRKDPHIRAMGRRDPPNPALNELIHASAVQRFETDAPQEDHRGSKADQRYEPINLRTTIGTLPHTP